MKPCIGADHADLYRQCGGGDGCCLVCVALAIVGLGGRMLLTHGRTVSADARFGTQFGKANMRLYHRPVASFNTGKKGEHAERRFFAEGRCGLDR